MSTNSDQPQEFHYYIYGGLYWQNRKLCHGYIRITEEEYESAIPSDQSFTAAMNGFSSDPAKEVLVHSKQIVRCQPGAIVELCRQGSSTLISASRFCKYLGSDFGMKIMVRSVALQTANVDAKEDILRETLSPIRDMYRSTNWQNRQAILAAVIRIITS